MAMQPEEVNFKEKYRSLKRKMRFLIYVSVCSFVVWWQSNAHIYLNISTEYMEHRYTLKQILVKKE